MQCSEFMQFLECEPDGPLALSAADHLEYCSRCRLLFEDLEGIRLAGFEWSTEEQPSPSPRVWLALREQLEAEGLIRNIGSGWPASAPPSTRPGWWKSWTSGWALRPALVGVPVLLAAIGLLNLQSQAPAAFAVSLERGSMIPASEQASPADDINRSLDSDIRRVMAALPPRRPSLATALQQNLVIVDNMIATCEKSVREQPDNPMVREYLYRAYQQKAVLLSTAVERTSLEDR